MPDKFWEDLEAEIPTWSWEERLNTRRVFKQQIENLDPAGKQEEREEEVYGDLEGWIDFKDNPVDLLPEWIYGRIASHLRISPFIQEEIYEKNRSLLKEVSRYFRNWRKRIDRRKGKRKPRGEYSAEDYPSLKVDPIEPGLIEYEFIPKIEEEVEFEAPGIVITWDDEGNPIQRVPGYGPGVPPERDKLEDELLVDIFHFLKRRGLEAKTIYTILRDIFSAFLGKSLTRSAIKQRIHRNAQNL